MGGRTDGKTDGRTDKRTYGSKDERTNVRTAIDRSAGKSNKPMDLHVDFDLTGTPSLVLFNILPTLIKTHR